MDTKKDSLHLGDVEVLWAACSGRGNTSFERARAEVRAKLERLLSDMEATGRVIPLCTDAQHAPAPVAVIDVERLVRREVADVGGLRMLTDEALEHAYRTLTDFVTGNPTPPDVGDALYRVRTERDRRTERGRKNG